MAGLIEALHAVCGGQASRALAVCPPVVLRSIARESLLTAVGDRPGYHRRQHALVLASGSGELGLDAQVIVGAVRARDVAKLLDAGDPAEVIHGDHLGPS